MSENLPILSGDNKLEVHAYEPQPADKITIAPNVLLAVMRMTVLRVPGVVRMGNTPGGVNTWLRRTPSERGIQAVIDGQTVTIDVYIVVDADANLREVSYNVQRQVARTIQDIVGMQVGAVNIHIEDVVFDAWGQPERG